MAQLGSLRRTVAALNGREVPLSKQYLGPLTHQLGVGRRRRPKVLGLRITFRKSP